MSNGNVITARGEVLNLDQLIENAKRPANAPKPAHSEVTKRVVPKAMAVNVRGFVPSATENTKPVVKQDETASENDSPMTTEPTGPSLADLTSLTISKPKYIRPAGEGEEGMAPLDMAEEVALGAVMNELKSAYPEAINAAQRKLHKETSGRKSKSKRGSAASDDDLSDLPE